MANVEQYQNEPQVVAQSTGLMATSSNAVARIREAIDQPGFRRAFPNFVGKPYSCSCNSFVLGNAEA